MRAISTHLLTPESLRSETEKLWCYNGLDCCVTAEVLEAISPLLDETTEATYRLRMAFMGPVLEMNMRGVLVDKNLQQEALRAYEADLAILNRNLSRITLEAFGTSINWNSPAQVKDFFYNYLKLPPVRKRDAKGQYTPTVNREALEKLANYTIAQPIINHLLLIRDISKKIGVLRTSTESDGRMRTSYNIGGTTTGRFSSSLNDFGTGTNLQNIEERLRSAFVADPGYKLAYIDLEQAESRVVGAYCWNLFHDGRYLDACESGDLHTSVCKLAWTNLLWTGDLKADKQVAEEPFYRQHSYRHMAKILGHGTNYNGKPPTMAKHTKLEAAIIREFQYKYFQGFPAIPMWHQWTAQELLLKGHLVSLLGMKRWFFGRRNDDTTVREAIAFGPQSTIGELLNRGMLAVWRMNICQLLLQIHDAILIQYPEGQEDEVIPQVLAALQIPIQLKYGRTLVIPSEAQVGWNWSKASDTNPDGLKKYKPNDQRKRTRRPTTSLLDRVVY